MYAFSAGVIAATSSAFFWYTRQKSVKQQSEEAVKQHSLELVFTPGESVLWLKEIANDNYSTDEFFHIVKQQIALLSEEALDKLLKRFGKMMKYPDDPHGPQSYAVTLIYTALLDSAR